MDDQFIDRIEFYMMLRDAFGNKNVEAWHTGGGIVNPVIVLERAAPEPSGQRPYATVYMLFSDGWCPEEASFSLFDDRGLPEEEQGGCGVEPIFDWCCNEHGSNVPMDAEGIVKLIRDSIDKVPGFTLPEA